MARLGAAADPKDAIRENLYIARPGKSVADQIVRRLELEPASSHLLVGGVGSGKTTQLLVAQKTLQEVPDVRALYVDVSMRHDLSRLTSGVLVVIAGLALGERLQKSSAADVKDSREQFRKWAHGWVEWVEDFGDDREPPDMDDYEPDFSRPVRHRGLLVPPHPPLRGDIKLKAEHLKVLQRALLQDRRHVVLLFDSLDRLTSLSPFTESVSQDIKAIRSAGIGQVVVGPLNAMFTVGRSIADQFDCFYHQPSVDVQQDEAGQTFLNQVLRRRTPKEVLPEEPLHRIVELSGGVLRDLISLARASGEEAYTASAAQIATEHVDSAADAFGRTLMLGLDTDEIAILQKVKSTGSFVPTSDKHLALLVTRRVLEYGNGRARYAVHPTIVPLLDQLSSKQ